MASGGGERSLMSAGSGESMETECTGQELYTHYLDQKEQCDLQYYVRGDRWQHDQFSRRIHVIKAVLQQKNSAFIDNHRILSDCIVITDVLPHIFFFMLEYVYQSLPEFKFDLLNEQDEIDHLIDAALRYHVRSLISECMELLRIRGMRPKSIFWLLDHYFRERTSEADWTTCVQRLSATHFSADALRGTESLKYVSYECLNGILQSPVLQWNVEQRFQMVNAWTKFECHRRGVPFNAQNIQVVLGATIDLIRIEEMGCSSFITNVFSSNFLTQELCVNYLRHFFQRRHAQAVHPGTVIADHIQQPLIADFNRFATFNILSGKSYGVRHREIPHPRRRRRRRPMRPQRQTSRNEQAASADAQRRDAINRDLSEITDRDDGSTIPDRGFGIPNLNVQEQRRITPRDEIADTLSFISSHDSLLKQVHVFGSDRRRVGHYQIELKILEEGEVVKFSRNFQLTTDGQTKIYPLHLLPPLDIAKDKVYTLYMVMEGPSTYQGVYGNVEVESANAGNMGVAFIPNEIGLNGTSNTNGQFPAIVLEKIRVLPGRN